MKDIIKQSVLDAIAGQFKLLGKGDYITHQRLIVENPPIMSAFYIYGYTLGASRTVAYLRRLCREVTDDGKYGCEHILAMRVPVKEGRRKPKMRWVWGWPNDSQGKAAMQEYDAKSAGIVKGQTRKAPQVAQPIVVEQTKGALEKAMEEKLEEVEEEAEGEEEVVEEAVEATMRYA